MAYTKQTWTNDVTAITAERMTHIEDGIYDNSLTTDKINPSGTATITDEFTSGQIEDVIGFKSFKLKGQTSQGENPTPDNPKEVENVSGYNVIEISNVNKLPYAKSGSYAVSGMTHTSNGKGTYTLNGTATANSRYDWEIEPYTIKQGDYLYLGNTATNSTVTVALLENASTQIMYTGPTQVNRIVSLNNYVGRKVTYLRTYTNAQTLNNFTLKPMICTTTSVSSFVEHQGNNFEINLGDIELCKLGTYQDYIFKRDGKWYKHKEVGKVVWDGTESWAANPGITTTYVVARPTDLAQANNNVLYNYFSTVADLSTATEGARIGSSINLKNPNTEDLASFKTWLGTNNVEMYYQSNTPTDEEITYAPLLRQLDELYNSGLYDVTNISQDNSSEAFILDIEACKNNINGIVEYIRR